VAIWQHNKRVLGLFFTAHAHKRLFTSFRSKIWSRHSLRRPQFPIRQMHFHYRVTLPGYVLCFGATTLHDLVTLTLLCCESVTKRQKWRVCFDALYLITRVSVNTRSRELFPRIIRANARIIRVSVKRPLDCHLAAFLCFWRYLRFLTVLMTDL